MNKIFKPLFIFILTAFLIACGKQTSNEETSGGNEPAKKSRGLIGATCMNIANPFFKVIEENMRDEAAKHGYDLIYLGCEMDISRQIFLLLLGNYMKKMTPEEILVSRFFTLELILVHY